MNVPKPLSDADEHITPCAQVPLWAVQPSDSDAEATYVPINAYLEVKDISTSSSEADAFGDLGYEAGVNPLESTEEDPRGVYVRCRNRGDIVLSFDDGPTRGITDKILDLLELYDLKATFFVLGCNIKSEADRETIRRIVREGHTLGSHTWDHPHLKTLSKKEIISQMNRTWKIFEDVLGPDIAKVPKIMRPPYGELDESVKATLFGLGYKIVLWNLDSNDWQWITDKANSPTQKILDTIEKGLSLKTKPGIITLFHDLYVETLSIQLRLYKMLQTKGYEVVSLQRCLRGGNGK